MNRDGNSRVAAVTGGASSIGQAVARRLAQDGHDIAIADIAPAGETEAMVTNAGRACLALPCDISSGESVAAFADDVFERFERCDVLVACAAIYPIMDFADTTWDDWRRYMSVNVDSLFHLTKAFLPGMVEAGWGRIITFTSTTFHSGTPHFGDAQAGVFGTPSSLPMT